MTTPALQQSDLNQFTGTQTYYRHALNRKVTYTDGVKYFADRAGARWLIDILATELERLARKHGILSSLPEPATVKPISKPCPTTANRPFGHGIFR